MFKQEELNSSFSYNLADIKNEGHQLGTWVSEKGLSTAPNEVTYYAIKDALEICSAIVNEEKYITESEFYSNIGNGLYAIKCGNTYSYTAGISFTIETSLGVGFETSQDKAMFTVKLRTSATVKFNEEYSEEEISGFKADSDTNQGAAYIRTLAWNGLWVKKAN